MSAAYLSAELWLGAFASVLTLILPPQTKTFCLAIYTSTIILIYSSAPQMIGLSLRHYEVGSEAYIKQTRRILAALIPVGYWVAGIGFLGGIKMVKRDLGEGGRGIGTGSGSEIRDTSPLHRGPENGNANGNNPRETEGGQTPAPPDPAPRRISTSRISTKRKMAFATGMGILGALTIALFVVSLTVLR
jgi:hypothetical protein